ncbi:hypothetical protein R11007_02856 [Ralstonia holmesii]|nr:hypothetical protein R11007_02856 [Ralstonia sp. LMG 32967]
MTLLKIAAAVALLLTVCFVYVVKYERTHGRG